MAALPLATNLTECDLKLLHILGPHWEIFILINHSYSLKIFLSTLCTKGIKEGTIHDFALVKVLTVLIKTSVPFSFLDPRILKSSH